MANAPIRFDDGAAYERGMGVWSRLAADVFLDWMAPPPALRWIDVGCGSGAFSEAVIQRCAPAEVQGVDPSEAQLQFARSRSPAATFHVGDAMALPFPDHRFDAAVMALVIFFVPDPVKGLAEMVRVVRPGGLVAAYAWDLAGGGFPFRLIREALSAVGAEAPRPPSAGIERMDLLQDLWRDAGLQAIETREITVHRHFDSIDAFWEVSTATTATTRAAVTGLTDAQRASVRTHIEKALAPGPDGRIAYASRANAILGRVPQAA